MSKSQRRGSRRDRNRAERLPTLLATSLIRGGIAGNLPDGENVGMRSHVRSWLTKMLDFCRDGIRLWTRPATRPIVGYVLDRFRSRNNLVRENALLRKQLEVACRQIARPKLTRADRAVLVLLARLVPAWRSATLLIQPETILRWHRKGIRLLWRRKSKPAGAAPRISTETIALIQKMALNNRLWGAERIRGELLKLNIRVAKRTIQKHMRRVRGPRPPSQRWSTFLRNHAHETWACDFLQSYDLLFRPIFAFFLIELGSRRVVHVGVTRSPSSAWVTQQLREATVWGKGPRFLIHDNDAKFGRRFDTVAEGMGISVLRTTIGALSADAVCERFLRGVRNECLDHIAVLSEEHLASVLRVLQRGAAAPGDGQRIPDRPLQPEALSRVSPCCVRRMSDVANRGEGSRSRL